MERQNSRRRRPPPAQDPGPSSPQKATTSKPKSHSFLNWILVIPLILVVVLAYLLRPDVYFRSWVGPWLGHDHGFSENTSNRPLIELHPEDHVYRAPVTHHLNWRVTTGQRRPDGVLKEVFLINGEASTLETPPPGILECFAL